jgi:hypothetical protein
MPSLAELIEAHQQTVAAHKITCDLTDRVLASQQGREVTLADEDACDHACEAERAALSRVLAEPVTSMSDVSTKAAYLLAAMPNRFDGLEPDELRLLLRSLIPAIEITT